jgi:ABC-2 type transport system ATP-binding protein
MKGPVVIEVRGLTKRYGDTLAVDGLSFDVPPGLVTGFLGPNGAGKSTTMRAIVGLDRPTAGAVTINGHAYADDRAPLTEVGGLLEAKAYHPGRSAFHHLLYLAQSNGLGRRRVREVLHLVGLDQVAGRRAGTFSLGMGQRLGIAAALLGDPPTLLFDEPVNGLDPEGIIWVRTLLRSFAAQGRAVLVSSHLMAEMALTADRLVVIGRGKLIADTTVREFVASAASDQVQVRSSDQERLAGGLRSHGVGVAVEEDGALLVSGLAAPQVGQVAFDVGVVVHELTPRHPSLEEAFMKLTSDAVQFHATAAAGPGAPGPSDDVDAQIDGQVEGREVTTHV